MLKFFSLFILLKGIFFIYPVYSQDIFSDLREGSTVDPDNSPSSSFNEVLIIKSRSRRVLIFTNKNQSFKQGDFVTMFKNSTRLAKAIVAKVTGRKAGLKVINTFNAQYDSFLNRGSEVQFVKGDAQKIDGGFTKEEQSFFSDLEGLDFNKKKEVPFENNIITLSVGAIQTKSSLRNNSNDLIIDNTIALHLSLTYSLHLRSNFWMEAGYGYSTLKQFPRTEVSTNLHVFKGRLKYNFKLPNHFYLMPYVGLEYTNGQASQDFAFLNDELDALDALAKANVVGGFTLHKKLVPGWLITLNAGLDGLHGGLSIAF